MVTQVKTPQIADTAITSPKMGILTTKGDILVFDTVHSRLPVGSNGKVLSADSNQASGLAWASPTTGLLYANTSVPGGNTVANTSSETNFTSSYTISANSLTAGQVIRITAAGIISTLISVSLTLKVKFGSTVLCTTGAILLTNGISNGGWRLQEELTVVSIGSSGSIETHGVTFLPSTVSPILLTNTNPVTVNTTSSAILQISATWNVISVTNSLTLRQMLIETLY